jgi:HK97 family phage portal protein
MAQRGFLDRVTHWLTTDATKAGGAAPKTGPSIVFFGDYAPSMLYNWANYDEEKQQQAALTSSWVYADIRGIANEISQAELDVTQGRGKNRTVVEDHPFLDLLNHPNDFMSRMFVLQYTIWWWLLRGEAYWLIGYDRTGEPTELWPLPSSRVAPIPDSQRYIKGFNYFPRNGMEPVRLDPEQIVYYRFPNPFDYARGLSPLSAYALALQADLSAAKWQRDTFDKGCTLQMLISLPKDIAGPEFKKRQAEIQAEMEEQRSRYMVVRAGEVTAEPVSMSTKDAELLAARAFSRDEIDRVFGYPEGYWSQKANRSNSEAAKASLIEQAVWPLLSAMASDVTLQLVHRCYGEEYTCLPQDIRPRDRVMALAEQKQQWVVKKVSEARAEMGLDPLGDERDDLTVSELTKQGLGGGVGGGEAQIQGEQNPGGRFAAFDFEACNTDLRKWQGIALRKLKTGERPGEYDFESVYIPPDVHYDILTNLKTATSEEEVKAAFAVPFRFPY